MDKETYMENNQPLTKGEFVEAMEEWQGAMHKFIDNQMKMNEKVMNILLDMNRDKMKAENLAEDTAQEEGLTDIKWDEHKEECSGCSLCEGD